MNNFHQCLKLGQAVEKKAQIQLCNYYNNKYTVTNEYNDNKFDFKMSNNKTYEVKYCSQSNCGDTVFLETLCNGKPSDINTTQSDYYIFIIRKRNKNIFLTNDVFLFVNIKVKRLIKIIEKANFCKYYTDSKKEGYIIDVDIIKKYGKII
jgi:hypothetical protein